MKLVKHMHDYFKKSVETWLVDAYGTYEVLGKPEFTLEDYARKIRNEDFYGYLKERSFNEKDRN